MTELTTRKIWTIDRGDFTAYRRRQQHVRLTQASCVRSGVFANDPGEVPRGFEIRDMRRFGGTNRLMAA
jgi:hypothetical protein